MGTTCDLFAAEASIMFTTAKPMRWLCCQPLTMCRPSAKEGWAFVNINGVSCWVQDFLRFHVFVSPAGQLVVLRRDDDGTMRGPGVDLTSFFSTFRLAPIKLRVGAGAGEQMWVCNVAHGSSHGAFLFLVLAESLQQLCN